MKLRLLPGGTGLDQDGRRWRRTVDGSWVEDPDAPIDTPPRQPRPGPRPAGGREELIEGAVPLALANYHKMAATLPAHVDRDALRGAALEALTRAVDRYDPAFGQTFNSYVSQVVWFAMLDEIRLLDRNWRAARRRGVVYQQQVSLDQPVAGSEDLTLGDVLPASGDVHDHVAAAETIREAFGCLNSREREVVAGFYQGATGAEIAARFGVSESRVCQIRARAIRRMRAAVSDTGLACRGSSPSGRRRRAAA